MNVSFCLNFTTVIMKESQNENSTAEQNEKTFQLNSYYGRRTLSCWIEDLRLREI